MNKRLSTILKYLIFLGLGLFFVWWSVRGINKEIRTQINDSLQNARYWLVIPVFGILMLSHLVRALRWHLLISSLGYHPKKINTFFAVMIGYLTNLAFPRLGEVLKCTMLAKYEKVPADKLIGTIILERIVDAISLLIVFGITLALQPHIYTDLINAFFEVSDQKEKKKVSGFVIAAIIIGIIVIFLALWMIIKKKKISDVVALFKKIGRSIWQGVSAVKHLKKRGLFIFYSAFLWSLYFIGGYVGFYALQETEQYGIKEAFTILSTGSIGMIMTPGGIGAYALLIQKTMQTYGLQEGPAVAFGWILWIVQTGVILIGGLVSFALTPYFTKRRKIETT